MVFPWPPLYQICYSGGTNIAGGAHGDIAQNHLPSCAAQRECLPSVSPPILGGNPLGAIDTNKPLHVFASNFGGTFEFPPEETKNVYMWGVLYPPGSPLAT